MSLLFPFITYILFLQNKTLSLAQEDEIWEVFHELMPSIAALDAMLSLTRIRATTLGTEVQSKN